MRVRYPCTRSCLPGLQVSQNPNPDSQPSTLNPLLELRAAGFRGAAIAREGRLFSSDDVFQETSTRYRAVEPEQWLQRHPEAGSSWPSWPTVSRSCHAKVFKWVAKSQIFLQSISRQKSIQPILAMETRHTTSCTLSWCTHTVGLADRSIYVCESLQRSLCTKQLITRSLCNETKTFSVSNY